MKTRNQAKRQRQSTGEDDLVSKSGHDTKANELWFEIINEKDFVKHPPICFTYRKRKVLHKPREEWTSGTLADTSEEAVNPFLKRVGSLGSRELKDDSASKLDNRPKGKEKQIKYDRHAQNISEVDGSSGHAKLENSIPLKADGRSPQQAKSELEDVMADSDWEDGSNPNLNSESSHPGHINKDIAIEFDASPGTSKRKSVRRASAEEKQVAELVHRTHLLCLLGRGRLIDSACDDPLIQLPLVGSNMKRPLILLAYDEAAPLASLLSLLPAELLNLLKVADLTVDALGSLVNWFHINFHVRSSSSDRSFHSALARALETHEGTPEESFQDSHSYFATITVLDSYWRNSTCRCFICGTVQSIESFNTVRFSARQLATFSMMVSLTHAVGKDVVSTILSVEMIIHCRLVASDSGFIDYPVVPRFVSILDAASLKPDADKSEDMSQGRKVGKGVFDSSTVMVTQPSEASISSGKQSAPVDAENVASVDKKNASEASAKASYQRKVKKSGRTISQDTDSTTGDQLNERRVDIFACEAQNPTSDACAATTSEGSKRKGDVEFEMQMEMALSATAVETSKVNLDTDVKNSHSSISNFSPFKRSKKIRCEESSSFSQGISTAVGSRKVGAPMYWAEVYCSGDNSTGKWVHVDAVNAIIDGEQKVEAAAAACKTSLRYVVAFAGRGAKDVTRRYCAKWYMIASHRVDSTWWDTVLRPLKELESRAIGGTCRLSDKSSMSVIRGDVKKEEHASVSSFFFATRTSLEDMELETKALTEPLPTNQQAYRSHHLYALERWLTKYQILHPKGPILGFCSGHPVYPRACVQMLHTKERWLREGLQLKVDELPVKVLKRSVKLNKGKFPGDEDDENDCVGPGGTINLYGKWQTEPLRLLPAENGIVPKNERGQVDLWSEKCLPPGTVHLGFPRIFAVAKKLEIDYAPAMVGFEFRNGRSVPLYDGIVVCTEFKDTILEAYAEEEERRGADERRKNEAQAISRWYQLLSSIITRQRLNNRYAEGVSNDVQKTYDTFHHHKSTNREDIQKPISHQANEDDPSQPDALPQPSEEDHEHVFLLNDPSSDDGSTRTKRCRCGFSIEVEEF
ncbi:DNA repair protein Rad4 [Cynara cardunculus var. scolymus]|uniref:DNA repair protein Rad4 n=1 Tax=Cynara cardunculus var. scolymus TaxID=59895 RepID=A0A103YGD0_CYNCS|nr:DNA repair protein Rad4 [Cynara cardunculus var. scolymus]